MTAPPTQTPAGLAEAPSPWTTVRGGLGDRVFKTIALLAGLTIVAALAGVFVFLAIKGASGFTKPAEVYGPHAASFAGYVGPLLVGTFTASIIALVIAVPLAFGIALVISHYAPRWVATPIAFVIDLLAAVPSVVYGLWGAFFLAQKLVPLHRWLHENLGPIPVVGALFGEPNPAGRSVLTAGIVLAIMILPIITAISREVFSRTPRLHEEAALALGATRWEMIRMTVFPYARSGMVSAVMLGLGRALGETMAVTMVLSVGFDLSWNIIATSSPTSIAANIALKYKERSPDLLNVLVATGLVLFLMTFLVNFAARWIVGRSERRMAR
ncbi:phosphate ABC transporter permease subunit PstC [Nocardioides sp. zg-536]|uniref:Phosphate transport system permease protein n=1 Tax=Nocardioides faecalis TaxID=2803858 RepID=A0A938Y729_9ACTN|nr:phosphate ABC transporter permease subunit PstC [Nocardioides faecalis]MBM9458419.1 phosphate ABC transporter permease subunit PstC [Nocardioides faecalis]MBS4753272.1 phosphate ABC transporter permease subunit PstC [Nocardioides faecalis]QVI58434.1 phosphate ABC transporter permease subunit PstC [Nocardioides faecalis]